MLANLLARRGLARAALAGLALGFGVLAGLSLWGTVSGQRAAGKVHEVNETRTAWDHMLVLISTETESMSDYMRSQDQIDAELLAGTIGSAGPTLTALRQHGDPADGPQIELISATYTTFSTSLRAVVAAARSGDRPQATAKATEASLSAASLRKQLNAAIEIERLELNMSVDRTNRDSQRLRKATLAVLGIDLVLLLMCAAMLLGYQRRIERHAQASSHRATHDSLTGLPNRSLFDDRLEQAVLASARTAQPLALLMVDLNGFKNINDTMGHHHGDILLKVVAQRLAGAVRVSDTVARLGGDEFAALLTQAGTVEQASALAWRLQDALREPADLEGETVRIGASIGIAMCPNHGQEARLLLRHADAAMYVAKRGRLGVVVYPGPEVGGASRVIDRGRQPAAVHPRSAGHPAEELSTWD